MADQAQRSRSVYIGNLPFDVKEDELKKIFSQVGTIVSLRMPNDPESGRSRGFAFCEYREQESVNVAIKHFNGYDLNGRKVRVDSAANNQDKDARVAGPVANDSQFGEQCDPVKAPEIIATVIGKMSPSQIQAILTETKRCLQYDPEEARVALANNPQMVYALLLALVRGRCITKERGTEALTKPEPPVIPLFPESRPVQPVPVITVPLPIHSAAMSGHQSLLGAPPGALSAHNIPLSNPLLMGVSPVSHYGQSHHMNSGLLDLNHVGHPSQQAGQIPLQQNYGPPPHALGDPGQIDRDRMFLQRNNNNSANRGRDRSLSGGGPDRRDGPPGVQDRRDGQDSRDRQRQPLSAGNDRLNLRNDRDRDGPQRGGRDGGPARRGANREAVGRRPDSRPAAPNVGPYPSETRNRFPQGSNTALARPSPRIVTPPPAVPSTSKEEQEKAELIMQVLRLREEDIAKMAPDQQRTVRTLRDQFKSVSK